MKQNEGEQQQKGSLKEVAQYPNNAKFTYTTFIVCRSPVIRSLSHCRTDGSRRICHQEESLRSESGLQNTREVTLKVRQKQAVQVVCALIYR